MAFVNPIQGNHPMSDTIQSDVVVDSSPQVEEVIEELLRLPKNQSRQKRSRTWKTEESETQDDEHSPPNGVKSALLIRLLVKIRSRCRS